MADTPKYPNIEVKLVGTNSNAFSIMGVVMKEMRKHKVSGQDIIQFRNECMSGDYNNLLATCMKWVEVT